jgi:AcrR family transcriptional regulator
MARTRAQDYAVKQDLILSNAAGLFAETGYSGTSIAMIAKACNVSKALLYHYYPDKEALLFDLISTHLAELIAVVETALAEAPQHDRLYAIALALLEAYRDADARHKVQLANLKFLRPDKQETLRALERRLVTLFADTIAETVPDIGHGAMLKPITMSLFGMLNWHYLWFRDGRGLTRADYARLATQMIAAGSAPASMALHDEGRC